MLVDAAAELVEGLIKDHHPDYGVGSMTCSIYDTAWISMVNKVVGDEPTWLFPSSFDLLLSCQDSAGGWLGHGTETDTILNTAAAILAICKHRRASSTSELAAAKMDLDDRVSRAARFLDHQLKKLPLGPSATLPVGFEMLVPKLVDILSAEGVRFKFPARPALENIRAAKIARIKLDKLYEGHKSTVLHSLEAFIGEVDFDRLGQHKQMGSMMASPASTTTYLMNVSTWDEEAEAYLQHVVRYGAGHGSGGVPSAFPSTHFEYTWVVATLLENGFTRHELGIENLAKIGHTLQEALSTGSGLIGFAKGLEPDGDDTAKGITSLNLIGRPTPASNLTSLVEVDSKAEEAGFRTYAGERDASITTSCNCLTALSTSPNAGQHGELVEMTMRYLCNRWNANPIGIRDKWHLSTYYPLMLMTQGLASALDSWGWRVLVVLSSEVLLEAMTVLHQMMSHLLRLQRQDGSWESKRELTAYAVIAINRIASLPTFLPVISHITACIQRAKAFLRQYLDCDPEPEHLWIKKVAYGSRTLSRAFLLSALRSTPLPVSPRLRELAPLEFEAILKSGKLFRQLPMLSSISSERTNLCLIESAFFVSRLRARCLEVFPGDPPIKERHLAYIPFAWISGNDLHGGILGSHILLEMMVISALAYQIDELIETSVSQLPPSAIARLKSEIRTHCHLEQTRACPSPLSFTAADPLARITISLSHFTAHILTLPHVVSAPPLLKSHVHLALQCYLSSHLTQLEFNLALGPITSGVNYKTLPSDSGSQTLYEWTHSTAGNHTAGPLAVSLFLCLLVRHNFLPATFPSDSPTSYYILQSVARHLSALCRVYNDLGSLERDRDEDNTNCANFSEFECPAARGDRETIKREMMAIAAFERAMLDKALEELENHEAVGEHVMGALRVFVSSANVFSELYLVRDMTPRVK